MTKRTTDYDVAIIGGGAAGLSAALTLGRSRRSVIVVDTGTPRNAPAASMHNFLSRDGMNPLDFLAAGRDELAHYGVETVGSTVRDTRREGDAFVLDLDSGRRVSASRLVLATGLVDLLPDIPGLAEYWGNDVLHCPFCHGWEVRDRRLGVMDGPMAAHQATMFTQWSKDVTLFKDPERTLSDIEQEQFDALGVGVIDGSVTSVLSDAGSVTGVGLGDGSQREIDALVIMPRFDADLSCIVSLGVVPSEHPSGLGRYLATPDGTATDIPGFWVAGSLANPMAQVVMAAADGAMTGMKVQADLMQEDTAFAVAEHRAQKAL